MKKEKLLELYDNDPTEYRSVLAEKAGLTIEQANNIIEQSNLHFGDWQVTRVGDLVHKVKYYRVFCPDLERHGILLHMMGKPGIIKSHLMEAYFKALEVAGIKEVTIQVYY